MSSRKPAPGKHSFTRKQLGAAMLEVLGSVGIGAVVLGGIADQTNRYMDSTKASTTGEFHRIASEAAAKYLYSTSDDLTNVANIPWPKVTALIPEVATFGNTNSFKEQFCLLGKKNPTTLKNEGVLIAKDSTSTGETTTGKNWRRSMMVNAGNVAMGRMTTATKASRGSTWTKDLSSWDVTGNCGGAQTGAVVTNLDMLQLASTGLDGLLHRNDEGRPELNRMNTAIDMNNQDITNAKTVYTDTLQLSGTSYLIQSTSNINLSATKDVIVMAGSLEKMRISAGGTVGIGTNNPQARLDVSGNVKAVDVTASGNVTATRNVTAAKFVTTGNEGWYSNTHGGGWYMSDSTWIRAYNNKAVFTGSVVRADSGFQVNGVTVIDSSRNAWLNDAKLLGALNFGTDTRQMINLYGTAYGIGVQNSTTYFRSNNDFQFYKGGSHNDAQGNAGGGTALMTIKSSGNVGIGTAAPGAKLDVNGDINSSGDVTASGNVSAAKETYTGGWFRTTGDGGWYSEKWGGGWHMSDSTWIRAYNSKSVYTPNVMRADTGFQVDGITVIDTIRNAFFAAVKAISLTLTGGDTFIKLEGTNGNNRIVGLEKIYGKTGTTAALEISDNGTVVTVNGALTTGGNITAGGKISGTTLKATTSVVVGNACGNKGEIAVTSTNVPVFCNNSGSWSRYAGLEINRYEKNGPAAEQPATARCDTGEVALAGGGYCSNRSGDASGVWNYMHYSQGNQNSWSVDCYDRRHGIKSDAIIGGSTAAGAWAHAYVVCVKASESLTLR